MSNNLLMIAIVKNKLSDKELAGIRAVHRDTGTIFNFITSDMKLKAGENVRVVTSRGTNPTEYIIDNLFYLDVKGTMQLSGGRAGALEKYPILLKNVGMRGTGNLTLLYKAGNKYVFADGRGSLCSMNILEVLAYLKAGNQRLTNAKVVAKPKPVVSLLLGELEHREAPKSPIVKRVDKLDDWHKKACVKRQENQVLSQRAQKVTSEGVKNDLRELLLYLNALAETTSYDSVMLAVLEQGVYSIRDMQRQDKQGVLLDSIAKYEKSGTLFTDAVERAYEDVLK